MTQQPDGRGSSKALAGSCDFTFADLIDLEILVQEDAGAEYQDPGSLRERDRGIYQQIAGLFDKAKLRDRRALFRAWLETRRASRFPGETSPGQEIMSLIFWMRGALFVAGLAMASSLVASFFRGAEISAARPEPINVSWYGLVCIAAPFGITVYGFWVLLGQRALPRLPAAPAFIRGALFQLMQPLLRNLAVRLSESLGPANRLNAQVLIGALKQRFASRKSALSAKLFHLVQALGIAFTAGVLLFSCLDCAFHSRVFGWQTTDQRITSAAVHEAITLLSLPWSWVQPAGVGSPTLPQVEQTRFVRFRDPASFPPEAATAWAGFLIWSAFVYGLLPRLLLALLSGRQAREVLRAEGFEELRFDPLWERMTAERAVFAAPEPDLSPSAGFPTINKALAADSGSTICRVILPSEIYTPARAAAMEDWVKQRKQWEDPGTLEMHPGLSDRSRLIQELKTLSGGKSRLKLLFVQESFMPPVQELLEFLMALKSGAGGSCTVLVGLVGKPDGTSFARPPKAVEADGWRKRILSLGDPNMDVVSFVNPA